MRVIDSMAELKKTQPENQNEIVYLKTYFSGRDVGGGFFCWDENATDVNDAGYCITVENISQGRWIRQLESYINYNMFGADDTGSLASDDAMYNAHVCSNRFNIPVIQKSGSFYWKNRTIPVYTSCDLTGAVIKSNRYSGVETPTYGSPILYQILPRKNKIILSDDEVSELNKNYSQYMVKNSTYLPYDRISEYKDALVIIESETTDIRRYDGGVETLIPKKDILLTTKDGGLLIGFARDFSDGDVSKVTIIPKEDSVLYFDSPKIDCNETVSFRFIECKRSNTQINGVVHVESGVSVPNIRTMISVTECDNINLSNFELEALQRFESTSGTYGLQLTKSTRIKLERLTGNDGWGITGSNYIKDVKVHNSYLNRFDCHWMAYDISINNSTFKNLGVYLTGGGHLAIRDCTFLLDKIPQTGASPDPVFFSPRKDYGQEWDGSILIDGLNIKISEAADIYKLYVTKFVDLNYDPGRDILWPSSILVKNVFINGAFKTNNEFFQAIMVSLNPVIASKDEDRKILCPDTLSVTDVFFHNVKVPSFATAVTWSGFANRQAVVGTYRGNGKVEVGNNLQILSSRTNCNITVRDISQQSLGKKFMYNDLGGVIQIIESTDKWDNSWYNISNKLALKFNVMIDNCQCSFIDFTAMGELRVANSGVLSIDTYSHGYAQNCNVTVYNSLVCPVSRQKNRNQWLLGYSDKNIEVDDEKLKIPYFINCEFVRPVNCSGVKASDQELSEAGKFYLVGSGNYARSLNDKNAYAEQVVQGFWAGFIDLIN
ncbi:hypothetical protein AAID35_005027 [Escherichia coli]